jgi:hypothetical protein
MNGCEDCFLSEECTGMKCYGGAPIEPPCTRWDPEDDLEDVENDYYARQIEHEKYLDRKIEIEKKEVEKKELKNKRARESRMYVYEETKKINRLRKVYNNNVRIISFVRAINMTNKMFDMEKRFDKTPFEIRNEEILKEIEEIKNKKKEKLKELRKKRIKEKKIEGKKYV